MELGGSLGGGGGGGAQGAVSPSAGVLGGRGKFLGYKYHLDWLKIDLNATKIIPVQVYKRTKI